MFYLACRNITRRLGQSVTTAFITLIAVLAVVTSFVVAASLENSANLSRERLGAEIMVLPSGASADASSVLFTAQPINVYLPESLCGEVAKMEGINRATPQFFTQTVDESCCSVLGATRIVGIDMETDFVLRPWISGSVSSLEPDDILLGASAPNSQGNTVSILGNTFFVAGTIEPTGTSVDETIFMDIDSSRNLAAASPYLTALWESTNPLTSISCIMVDLAEGADADKVAAAIMAEHPSTTALTTSSLIADASSQINAVASIALGLVAMLVAVSALALVGRFSALVESRKKELGLMRTMGIPLHRAVSGLLLETGIVTIVASALGIACACLASSSVLGLMHSSFSLPGTSPSTALYAVAATVGFLFAILLNTATIAWPTARLFRADPQELLSKGDL